MSTIMQVCEETGLTYRQVDNWINQGYLEGSSYLRGIGSGTYRSLSASQVLQLKRMAELIRCGFTIKAAAHISAAQGHAGEDPTVTLPGGWVLTDLARWRAMQ
jgi:DNA-binding transcriptional MerR regulator